MYNTKTVKNNKHNEETLPFIPAKNCHERVSFLTYYNNFIYFIYYSRKAYKVIVYAM